MLPEGFVDEDFLILPIDQNWDPDFELVQRLVTDRECSLLPSYMLET
jgi:hypothetical protein